MENKMKHTKGNWYLQEFTDVYTNIVRCDNGTHNTLFIASTPHSASEEARSNARLISAAPDMLDALNDARAILQELWDEDLKFRKGKYSDLSGKIYSAIKKATGSELEKGKEVEGEQRN